MQIPVIVEPAFRPSSWCRQTLNGMYTEAKRKKYVLHLIDYKNSLMQVFAKDAIPRIVIVVGTSITFVPDILNQLEALGIQALLVNYDNFSLSSSHSVVRMDYINAMQSLLSYFTCHGKSRIALLGINANSSADNLKERYFLAVQHDSQPLKHVFRNKGSIHNCICSFLPYARQYDALLCANDLVAVAALSQLRDAGLRVPDDLMIAGFGESILAQKVSPAITTVTLNHEELGRQAVMLFAYLYRQNVHISATIKVESQICVRGSTANLAPLPDAPLSPIREPIASIDFYKDPEICNLLAIEDFCLTLDPLDQKILYQLAEGETLETIAERCHISLSTIGYRLRGMQSRCGASSRQELIDRIFSILDANMFLSPNS